MSSHQRMTNLLTTLQIKPPVFHCQVFSGKKTVAFYTRKTYAEAKMEGENSIGR